MKTLFHKVVSVEALPDFVLGVRFSGGEEKRYDMKPVFAAWPMFEGLRKSPELFGEVAVGPGGYGVVWGDEWDVGADELFANGVAHAEARRGRADEFCTRVCRIRREGAMTGEMKLTGRGEKLLADVRGIIEETRRAVYAGVAAVQLEHNWKIGRRIVEEEQGGSIRAEYAKRTIAELSAHLCAEFGNGYAERTLWEYRQFYTVFPDFEILRTRAQNLAWSHFRLLMRVGEPKVREWYMQEASNEGWSVRTLDRNIATQYCQRLLASQADRLPVVEEMKEKTAAFQRDRLEFIKNPSVLEFIGLKGNRGLVEDDLEKGILDHLQEFLLELGKGFAFVESQRLVRTECKDYFVDLVFYNFILKCFFLIDLKMGRITHQDVGQMDMYVRMFDELVKRPDDNPTIGIVLCADTDPDIARYSILHGNERLFASKYQLQLPTPKELTDEVARQRQTLLLQLGEARAEARGRGGRGSTKGQKGGQGVAGANEQTILRCNDPTEP